MDQIVGFGLIWFGLVWFGLHYEWKKKLFINDYVDVEIKLKYFFLLKDFTKAI